jgi:hypothetical protein
MGGRLLLLLLLLLLPLLLLGGGCHGKEQQHCDSSVHHRVAGRCWGRLPGGDGCRPRLLQSSWFYRTCKSIIESRGGARGRASIDRGPRFVCDDRQ